VDALTLAMPVDRVTLLEDRALVERRGSFLPGVGRHRVRVDGIALVAVDRSLRVEAAGATVTDARVVRAWKERITGGLPQDASLLRQRVQSLEAELQERSDAVARASSHLTLLSGAQVAVLRRISEEAGANIAAADRWREQMALLRGELGDARCAQQEATAARTRTERSLAEVRAALARSEAPLQEVAAALELMVEVTSAEPVVLTATYLVPCAMWRPAYRATLLPSADGERLLLEADAVIWQRTGEPWLDTELHVSTARPSLGTKPPVLEDDVLQLRDKSELEKRVVGVELREEQIQTVGEGGATTGREIPGVDDGGQTQRLAVEGRHSVAPDGSAHRVRLFRMEVPARTEWWCAPELSEAVVRVARFENVGPNVLLAGPVELVRGSGYVGRTTLRFSAVNEQVRLSFGSEDSLRVVRRAQQAHGESRLTGRRTTRHEVKLFASNLGDVPSKVALEERIPVSEVEQVEVSLDREVTRPPPAVVTDEGIVRFEVELPAHGRQEVTLGWELSASAKVAGAGFGGAT
jgi:uncharacterized protein (TIGR02231 family)